MIKKMCCVLISTMLISFMITGCSSNSDKQIKLGVSFGVGHASRWESEKGYMESYAKELGIDIEVRLNQTDTPLTQEEDCKEMIDGGIDVLLLTPRDANNVSGIIAYAKQHNVKVICYARVVAEDGTDLFIGYDCEKIGQTLGKYLAETVYQGDYIILRGDESDQNGILLYQGAMKEIETVKQDINILLDEPVAGWDPAKAKQMVKDAIIKNENKVDAILAPNDKIAGACAEAIAELGITTPVAITGMDAELDAVKRILHGTQSVTIYMDLKLLAETAIDEACNLANGKDVNTNAQYTVNDQQIDAHLINGYLITDKNLDKILIESGYFTKEQVYETK